MAISVDIPTTPRVAQLAAEIQRALRSIGSGWVEGEVQKLRRAASGHVYFSLADEDATIDCCIWRQTAARVGELPEDGTLVQARFTKVDFYAPSGRISLHVDAIRPTGEGELLARRQAALARLQADGLVARARRPLPRFPRRVGVIAARNSDAKTDVIKALRERWPSVHVVHRAALVEGVHAVDSMIEAVAQLQDVHGVDVIVLARGGGGVRDLVAFDDERLCRAVFACAVPVVTSVGHTAQRPNCDHVAAAFADVPARAAELVVPSAAELRAELLRFLQTLERAHGAQISGRRERLDELWSRVRVHRRLARELLQLDGLVSRLERSALDHHSHTQALERLRDEVERGFARRMRRAEGDVATAGSVLAGAARRRVATAHLVLEHIAEVITAKDFRSSGWVLAADAAGRPLRSAHGLLHGARLRLHFHDGAVEAAVTDAHAEGDAHV